MAYVNVAQWSPEQTADWLKGVGGSVALYAPIFVSNEVQGEQLLSFRADDLENLSIYSIGHQELILEAVAQLRNFHYELDRENLQHLALKLSCAATSLYKELLHHQDRSKVETQTLSDVTYVIGMVKPLALWLDRSPFSGQLEYMDKKAELLRLSLEMATCSQRDRFAESPIETIETSCRQLATLSDKIIQEISDPMVLQPATLNLVTLKKRDNELGFDILPSCNGIHQVIDIKYGSPAHSSGKIENGDEIVQVNYQTVVGWQPSEVLLLCQESPVDVLLTLKKRPRHTHTYGQIYMKPYRLPSRKRSTSYNKWGSLPSPRPELLKMSRFEMPPPKTTISIPPSTSSDGNISSDESETLSPPGTPTTFDHVSSQNRMYLPKPRSVVQRRNTISGGSPLSKRANFIPGQNWWKFTNSALKYIPYAELPPPRSSDDISDNLCLRDKSVSCSTGLETSPRPKTCLGVGLNHSKIGKLNGNLASESSDSKSSTKAVKFHDQIITNENEFLSSKELKEQTRERGRLDKSHSTPAYDFGESENGNYPLVKEIIPESPTSVDSPSIVVHSHQKVEQILEFKKSSEQIGGAMIQQQVKDKTKIFENPTGLSTFYVSSPTSNSSQTNVPLTSLNDSRLYDIHENTPANESGQVFEAINIALLEHKKKKEALTTNADTKLCTNSNQNIFAKEFGESYVKKLDPDKSEQIQTIQNELVEAIKEQHLISTNKTLHLKPLPKLDITPEPPPRPSTQKPGHIGTKPRHIQKEDIQVIPNIDITPPALGLRKDFLIYNPIYTVDSNMPFSPLLPENKHLSSNLSTSELASPKTPLMSSRSLQKLEPEQKSTVSLSHSSINKIDSSFLNMKTSNLDASKLSPANSMVRGILSTGKSKSLKKKNSILAKRRKVSVKDLGAGDMQGFLYQRCRTKNSTNVNWKLRWFILIENTFYGFKNKEASKADCLIFLSGFTVSEAQEVKSKKNAFKVYHTGTAFYFACEAAESMTMWVECIKRATLTNNDSWERASKKDKKTDESKHFSETDYSDEDFATYSLNSPTSPNGKSKSDKNEKNEKSHKFGSLKKFTNRMHKSDSHENVSHSSTSLDRKYLRFFSSKHKHKEEKPKLKSGDVPVPTEQYRSYRKIPSTTITIAAPSDDISNSRNANKNSQPIHEDMAETISHQNIAVIKKIEPIEVVQCSPSDENFGDLSFKQTKKSNPIDYIHASNPNLLEFDRSQFIGKFKNKSPFSESIIQRHEFAGMVTLEQFMLSKQEEERQQVYSNRVLMGVERDARNEEKNQKVKSTKENDLQKELDKIVPDVIYGRIPSFNEKVISTSKVDQIQNRSLPKTPDGKKGFSVSESKEYNSNDAQNTSSIIKSLIESVKIDKRRSFKSSLRKKNDGYETIKYDDIVDKNETEKLSSKEFKSQQTFSSDVKTELEKVKETQESILKSNMSPDKAKEFGYELLYADEPSPHKEEILLNTTKSTKYETNDYLKDLGYETIYDDTSRDTVSAKSLFINSPVDPKSLPRRNSEDKLKPNPPPKIMTKPKYPIAQQSSGSSIIDRKLSNVDSKPVFKQGESTEKFWLDSLRRNDKVYSSKGTDNVSSFKLDKFYTKHSEPSAYMKSSEATIVKSDKLQNKVLTTDTVKTGEHKQLKSAIQYTPMSLPVSPDKALKTSPKFELSLDSRDTPSVSGMSRLRHMFQHSSPTTSKSATASPTHSSPKEKTLLGSPRLHRAIFRKNQNTSTADEWAKDFSYSKMSHTAPQNDDIAANESYLFSVSPSESVLTPSSCDVSNISNISTPDYPNLEYPPVFEPETYSLADPGPSILKKFNYDQDKN
ncbi:connector enhancer of ksr [Arctopsyche grandis]|uniref:connector enhancer of ksr n=1 Tax=Arctopsyche grandis TaxID=121162 RepID=UPI00406D780F